MFFSIESHIVNYIANFIFFYPLLMSVVWTMGAIFYRKNYEKKKIEFPISFDDYPSVTILVPCHNEASTIAFTCSNLRSLNYLNYNVIFIDDASTDDTLRVLNRFASEVPFFNIIQLTKNKGKAGALNAALYFVSTPYVLILDADTVLDKDALKHFIEAFLSNGSIAAVTGNPMPLNRTNFLSKLQTAEFMSIIGLIKRCQCLIGKLYTVSGCATMYKTSVLREIGGLSKCTATEDIDVTWRIQKKHYNIWFEPKAIAYIQVPTKFKEYIKQRKRWAMGGWHLLRTHCDIFRGFTHMSLWLIYLESALAHLWSFCFIGYLIFLLIDISLFGRDISQVFSLSASILTLICIIQMAVAISINSPYDKQLKSIFFWTPWYPIVFFSVGSFLVTLTSVKGLFGSRENSGKWKSPAREVKSISSV